MDKSTIMRTFNTHFIDFFNDIITIFPEKIEIQTAKTAFESMKRSNPSLVIRMWYSHIYLKYNEAIEKGDIDFFFNKDYNSDLSETQSNNEIISFINEFREPLRNMNPANKEHSIKYIQNLSKLSVLWQKNN
jgi:hypothetical protein